MTTLILYASALLLGFLIVAVVALVHAIITHEHTKKDKPHRLTLATATDERISTLPERG
jgi:hypothetical protein